jgi:polyribonucleotide nucleotidyltransferase
MNEMKKVFNLNYGGKDVSIEVGRLAKQADGTAFVTCGGTQVLVTVCCAKDVKEGQDFFPLLVDYKEKYYAAGKFVGGFQKRESRPSNSEILLMRMVDRPFRPLFPEGFMFETVIQATVHSYDQQNDPEVLAGLGAAAALAVSDVPFNGPAGFCKVGRINGQLVLNPTPAQWKESDLELVVAGSKEAILMVEGEASEVPEAQVIEAIMFGHDHIKTYCTFLDEIVKAVGKTKREFHPLVPNATLMKKLSAEFGDKATKALRIDDKLDRRDACAVIINEVKEAMKNAPTAFGLSEGDNFGAKAQASVDELLYKLMRHEILFNKRRIAGRTLTEVRQIETEVDVLKNVHGSSLFTRGETQVLAAVTIGGKVGEQLRDNLQGTFYDRFYLHYTFAPYCVGEARGYRGVGRREIGHGNLAERAIRKVLPKNEDFPYTIRIACEVLESNGSSSMGSVCSGSMALMDAGAPLKAAVAGVAMGLIKEGENYAILTDILGDEDHLGDMDFKVAGTEKGVTAIQMDIKISGITKDIFVQAMEQAHTGRLHILNEMKKTISTNRKEFKEGVPRIRSMHIEVDKIGALIGPSGKNIKGLQENFGVTIEVQDDGTVKVIGNDPARLEEALNTIELQITGPKVDKDYMGTVVSVKEYGAFVDLAFNVSGLLHVSEISNDRVREVTDYLKEGDLIKVRVTGVDKFGKIKLSAKAIESIPKK